ncbi:MAG: AarF/UbiB family protein, partial [Rickettsiales bacterium]|nr:AarF/UbiB family protein [Rickettsiales bacterium]
KPVAAASIAQVHFAKTFNDEDVAVKILRPNIKEKFIGDIELVIFIARFFARFSKVAKRIKFLEIMEIFRKNSLIEMDFLYEASAAAELAENFKNDENIRIPKVYWDYSAKEILTIERFFGSRIDDIETLKNKGIDVNDILKKSSLIFVNQVLRDGFFHADMHPGNVLVDDEGKICIFDFGIMGRLDKKTRVFLAELLIGFLNRDYKKVADLHFDYGFVPLDQDRDLFAQACRFINEPILNHPQNQISIAKLLENLLKMAEDFKMNTDPRLFLLQKTMVMAEGIGRMLNDKANFWNISEDIIKDWGKENLGLKSKIFDIFEDVKDILKKLKFLLDEAVSKKNMN